MGGAGPQAGRGSHPVGGPLRRRGGGGRLRSPGAERQEGQGPGQEQAGRHHPARRLRPADGPGGSPSGNAGILGTLPRQCPTPGRRVAGVLRSAQRQPAPHRPQGAGRSTGSPAVAHPAAVAVELRPAQPPAGPGNTTIGRPGRFPGNHVPGELGSAGHRRGGPVSESEDPDLPRDRLPLRLRPERTPSRHPALLPAPARQGQGQDRLPVGRAHSLPGAAAGQGGFKCSSSHRPGGPASDPLGGCFRLEAVAASPRLEADPGRRRPAFCRGSFAPAVATRLETGHRQGSPPPGGVHSWRVLGLGVL